MHSSAGMAYLQNQIQHKNLEYYDSVTCFSVLGLNLRYLDSSNGMSYLQKQIQHKTRL